MSSLGLSVAIYVSIMYSLLQALLSLVVPVAVFIAAIMVSVQATFDNDARVRGQTKICRSSALSSIPMSSCFRGKVKLTSVDISAVTARQSVMRALSLEHATTTLILADLLVVGQR